MTIMALLVGGAARERSGLSTQDEVVVEKTPKISPRLSEIVSELSMADILTAGPDADVWTVPPVIVAPEIMPPEIVPLAEIDPDSVPPEIAILLAVTAPNDETVNAPEPIFIEPPLIDPENDAVPPVTLN